MSEEERSTHSEEITTTPQHVGDIEDLITQIMCSAEFWIAGMTCTVCSGTIEQAIRHELPHVCAVAISLATDTATVTWPASSHDDDMTCRIKQAIEAVGYSVEKVVVLNESSPVNNNNNSTNDEEQPMSTNTFDEMEERWQQLQQRQTEKVQGRRNAFLWSLVGTVPILSLTMFLPHLRILQRPVHIWHFAMPLEALILWMLATPVQFLSGWEFYKGAFFAIFVAGRAGMDVLIALGTTASYSYAVVGVLTEDTMAAHFFETSAVLICFVLGGKWMQAVAVRRTSQALTQLLELQAKTAIQVTPLSPTDHFDPSRYPYRETVVPIQNIGAGDIVKVIQGTSIPADGIVLVGEMSVDESMVTGEAMPVLKFIGASVLGGTVCVEAGSEGASFCQVTGVGAQTALAQIVQLVHDAQTRTVPIQTFADSISALFVPAVCSISVVTFLVWYALCSTHVVPSSWYENEDPMTFSILFAIACLVISCPCALGLATPTAVMVGTGVSAKVGILLKGGESLEVASTVDSVVFDKTGTLTKVSVEMVVFVGCIYFGNLSRC
jgi:Cu+-exporting ATPase